MVFLQLTYWQVFASWSSALFLHEDFLYLSFGDPLNMFPSFILQTLLQKRYSGQGRRTKTSLQIFKSSDGPSSRKETFDLDDIAAFYVILISWLIEQ